MRRALGLGLAVLAVPAAAACVVLAVDVLRVPDRFAKDDLKLESVPSQRSVLWTDVGFLPWSLTSRTLDVRDDVEYRRVVAIFARIQPGIRSGSQESDALRGQAILALTRAARSEEEARRASQLLNFRGALSLDRSVPDAQERALVLREAIDSFRSAIELDPTNADAKVNLELALRIAEAQGLPGDDPSGEKAEGERSGAGRPGTGY